MKQLKKLALICGGPSKERGISLNSARSVMDHLKGLPIEISSFFVDTEKHFHIIDPNHLYSNTPADFDFKLKQHPLKTHELHTLLKGVDLVFPVIHGEFGEDGELQSLLEHINIPFLGHDSSSCQKMYPKHVARSLLQAHHFVTQEQLLFSHATPNTIKIIKDFFQNHSLTRAIVKPSCGGSSIGVHSVSSPEEACEKIEKICAQSPTATALLEPFFRGKEFTIVVLQNHEHKPVALIPTEVELDYEGNEIFDYRKKYLPTNLATHHTPPRFSVEQVQEIRRQAEEIFVLFNMRDFVRMDGWILHDGSLCFTDINPISGLEQNSFFFRQTSLIGLSHKCALEYLLKSACQRYNLILPETLHEPLSNPKQAVFVLFGNSNSERQVSLMSGTNVWLKLLQSHHFVPTPYFLDSQESVWELPYFFALNHTVEEIYHHCLNAEDQIGKWLFLIQNIRDSLDLRAEHHPLSALKNYSLENFTSLAEKQSAFIFIALHGGIGENGTLQRYFEQKNIRFNGCREEASMLCMDKFLTGHAISNLNESDITSLPKILINPCDFKNISRQSLENHWNQWTLKLSAQKLIIKPKNDGCSAGIVLLTSPSDFASYCDLLNGQRKWIPSHTFSNQHSPIEMSLTPNGQYLLEPYIETDEIIYKEQALHITRKSGWIELTIGVFEEKGYYKAFNPSITVVEGAILSLEEKFQGGTGINLTPPPPEIISTQATEKIKGLIEIAAKGLKIENYARIDFFFNVLSEKIIIIEANTLPALTPSTVIYHQALAENPSISPLDLLEKIIHSRMSTSHS